VLDKRADMILGAGRQYINAVLGGNIGKLITLILLLWTANQTEWIHSSNSYWKHNPNHASSE